MANPKHKLKREDLMAFLLGELEDAEQSRIESMFLEDDSLRDVLETAKSELFQEYKSGRLSERLSGAFEKRFLPASIEKDRQEFREMLAKNEAERSEEARGEAAPAADTRRSSAAAAAPAPDPVASLPARPPAAVKSAAKRSFLIPLVLLLVLGAGGAAAIALVKSTDSASAEQSEVTLRAFSVRGQSQLVTLPPGDTVFLALPHPEANRYPTHRVRLLFGSQAEDLATTREGGKLGVTVARETLQEGRYDVELSGVLDTGESKVLGYYSFHR